MVQDAQPQREGTPNVGRGHQRGLLPEDARENLPVHALQRGLVEFLRGAGPETQDPELRGADEFEVRTRLDELLRPSRQIHPLVDCLPEGGHPEGLDRHPDLQGAETAARLQVAVHEVRVVGAPDGVLQDVRPDRKGVFERADVLHEEATGFIALEEPLVRVQFDRIRPFDAVQEPPSVFGQNREPAVRGIHMEPETFRGAVVGQLGERIHGSDAWGSRVCGDQDRVQPRGPILPHRRPERLHVQTPKSVARERTHALGAHAHDARRPGNRTVGLIAQVDDGTLGISGGLAGRDEGVQGGGGPTAGEDAAGALRVPEPAPEPLHHHQFELARAAGDQPVDRVDVVSGGEKVGEHPGPGRGRGNEGEAARVVEAGCEPKDFPPGPLEHVARGLPVLGRVLQQQPLQSLAKVPVPGTVGAQLPVPFDENLRGLTGELQHELGRHLEAVAPLAADRG